MEIRLGLPGLHNREIGYNLRFDIRMLTNLYGWAEPGASVHVHIPGIIAQWVQVDGSGQWSLSVNKLINDNTQIEIFQAKGGYLNSQKAVYFIHKNSQSRYYPNLGRVE